MEQATQHNLDCTDLKALLSALVDDEVNDATRHDAERHLANCASCRALLDEAESVDQLLRDDFTRRAADGLPMGFEQSVLSLMRDDHRISAYWRNWTTWAGWLAAAACLALAVTMWVGQDHQARLFDSSITAAPTETGGMPNATESRNAALARGLRRSWTLDDNLPAELEVFGPPAPVELTSRPASMSRPRPTGIDSIEEKAGGSEQTNAVEPSRQPDRAATSLLTSSDRSSVYLASVVLDMVVHADLSSYADIEEAREIIEYDGLIDRLANCRDQLNAADRSRMVAAEMVLIRIAQGPLDRADVEVLQRTIDEYNLVHALDTLSATPRSLPAI